MVGCVEEMDAGGVAHVDAPVSGFYQGHRVVPNALLRELFVVHRPCVEAALDVGVFAVDPGDGFDGAEWFSHGSPFWTCSVETGPLAHLAPLATGAAFSLELPDGAGISPVMDAEPAAEAFSDEVHGRLDSGQDQ